MKKIYTKFLCLVQGDGDEQPLIHFLIQQNRSFSDNLHYIITEIGKITST